MYEIALINMPFARVQLPSIALTQLRSVVQDQLGDRVSVKVFYLNHEFARHLGLEQYASVADSVQATVAGLGDWLFRSAAFPDVPDNAEAYLGRHIWNFQQQEKVTELANGKRDTISPFLDEMIDRYALDTFALVGFTSMFMQSVASFALARKIKERNPDIVTVMGGANCEMSMGQVIARNVEAIDYTFSGPALKTFPSFVGHMVENREEECHKITGVFSKKNLALRVSGGEREIGEELDIDIDVPLDYDDFFASCEEKWPGTVEPALLFETSRGCWWGERAHCTFCGLNGATMKYRPMRPDKALSQFDQLFRYASRTSDFRSVDNIMPKEYLTDVFPHLDPPENVRFFYEIKANMKDREMKVLSEAHVKELQPGIESLATSTLKLMKKGTTAFQNIKFLKSCLRYDILPDWNLLIGFPGEEEDVYEKYLDDLPLLVHLPPPGGVYPIRFDRFSPYFTLAEEYGLKLEPYDFYGMIYPFKEHELKDLAYFFADQNFNAPYARLTAKWIKKLQDQVERWRDRWLQRDQKLKPSLTFAWSGSSQVVYDSRSGTAIEHELDATGLRALECLASPMKLSRLAEELSDVSESELRNQISMLQDKRLIFEEREIYMSLLAGSDRESGYL